MSREILDCLKRKQDICIKNIKPSQNTAFMCTPALRAALYKYQLSSFGREKMKFLKLSQMNGLDK